MNKENYQILLKAFKEHKTVNILGVDMFVNEIRKTRTTEYLSRWIIIIIIDFGSGSVLRFSTWEYDSSWEEL